MSDPTDDERLPGGLTRAQFVELHETNPIKAAQYSREHGVWLHNDAGLDPNGWRRASARNGAPTPDEAAAKVRAALSWTTQK